MPVRILRVVDPITHNQSAAVYCSLTHSHPPHTPPTPTQGYGSIFIADGIHAEALGVGEAAGEPVKQALLDSFLKVCSKRVDGPLIQMPCRGHPYTPESPALSSIQLHPLIPSHTQGFEYAPTHVVPRFRW
jgi:hypothetical protein